MDSIIRVQFGLILLLSAIEVRAARLSRDEPRTATARAETTPVPHDDDAADDPAIWVHPSAPELSLILGTDKQGGLHIYNLDGTERAVVAREAKPNNVDVLYGFKLGERMVDLAVMSTRAERRGLQVWAIASVNRDLRDVTERGNISVLPNDEPYGCCTYKSARSGTAYVFVTSKSGAIEQYALRNTDRGTITAEKVWNFNFKSAVEACVADEELGVVYFGEEQRGIWKVGAEPAPKRTPKRIARVGDNGLHSDVEGLAIYYARQGRGYLIVSSQGNNSFKLYERGAENRYVATFNPVPGRYGDVEDTDGIAVTSAALPPHFPRGLFIAQDGKNGAARQNFKLFAWQDIAGTNLLIDVSVSARR